MKNRRWNPSIFFETGRQEIDELMRYAGSLDIELVRHRALDFGCGVGRLSRALADHFDEVYGVDISPAMLALAREYNAHIPNCSFLESLDSNFSTLTTGSFDLIYSSMTLQHIPPRHAARYLRALMGRLRPGGLLIFQLSDECRRAAASRLCSSLYQFYRKNVRGQQPSIVMYGMRKQRVIALIERNGCRILGIEPNQAAGPEWTSYRYAAVRT